MKLMVQYASHETTPPQTLVFSFLPLKFSFIKLKQQDTKEVELLEEWGGG